MKKLLAILMWLMCWPTMTTSAHDFEVDGIYYNILSDTEKTVELTYAGYYNHHYSGSLMIPESVSYNGTKYLVIGIGDSAFRSDASLTNIFIPNTVKSIGYRAFEGCSALKEIVIPNSVTTIDYYAFCDCSNLTSITIPNSVTSIEDDVFSGCTNLVSISIPSSVTSIEDGAFRNCSNLTSITIPNSVTSIEDGAFSGCTNLVSISIPSSATSMGEGVFNGCPLLPVEDGIQYADTWAVNVTNREEDTYTLRPNTTGLASCLFVDCKNMTFINIPNSVKYIGEAAFN